MHRIASVHKYICLLFAWHLSHARLAKFFRVIYHSAPKITSPLLWKASYLVQSDHHQVQHNAWHPSRTLCLSFSVTTYKITDKLAQDIPKHFLDYLKLSTLFVAIKKNSFLHDKTLCSSPKTVTFVLVVKRRICSITAKC